MWELQDLFKESQISLAGKLSLWGEGVCEGCETGREPPPASRVSLMGGGKQQAVRLGFRLSCHLWGGFSQCQPSGGPSKGPLSPSYLMRDAVFSACYGPPAKLAASWGGAWLELQSPLEAI